MGLKKVDAGKNVPADVNVVIEIPSHSAPIKYEVDKDTGVLMVDRFFTTSMSYPCEYGYIPQTLSEDGDPVDVLVVCPFALNPGVVVRARPIGLMRMTDESGVDTKILAVPVDKLSPRYQHIKAPIDLGQDFLDTISHFFTHYKDLEKGKWVKVGGWENVEAAHKEILASAERFKQKEMAE